MLLFKLVMAGVVDDFTNLYENWWDRTQELFE
jgi:hypothetical protein